MTGKELEKARGILIDVFFKTYYEIDDIAKLQKLGHCSHQNLRWVALKYGCELERAWSDEISLDEVICGDVVVVTDIEHHNGLYVNPRRKMPCFIPEGSSFDYPMDDELTEEDYIKIDERYQNQITDELCEKYADFTSETSPKTYKIEKGKS